MALATSGRVRIELSPLTLADDLRERRLQRLVALAFGLRIDRRLAAVQAAGHGRTGQGESSEQNDAVKR